MVLSYQFWTTCLYKPNNNSYKEHNEFDNSFKSWTHFCESVYEYWLFSNSMYKELIDYIYDNYSSYNHVIRQFTSRRY